jgi:hypothetical protein
VSGASTNELGELRAGRIEPGTYVLHAIPHNRGSEMPAGAQPLPTFHPATLSIDQAERFAIHQGQSIADLDLMLLEGAPNVIAGTVVDSQGQPVKGGHVSARSVGEAMGGSSISDPDHRIFARVRKRRQRVTAALSARPT